MRVSTPVVCAKWPVITGRKLSLPLWAKRIRTGRSVGGATACSARVREERMALSVRLRRSGAVNPPGSAASGDA